MTVIKDRDGFVTNRGYFGDTGGNVWRIDMADADPYNWSVTKLASIADPSVIPGGMRKFLYPPDVVYADDHDAVIIGSGDREHPLHSDVQDRMYMFKDRAIGKTALDDSGEPLYATLTEANLYNTSSDCVENSSACAIGEDSDSARTFINSMSGWYFSFAPGEKAVGHAITLNSVTFFNTHQPAESATGVGCVSNLGVARAYQVYYNDATAVSDKNQDGEETAEDRSHIHAGGGFLPPPTPVIVQIDDKTVLGVVSGVMVATAPGVDLGSRIRRFWFKEME